MDVRQFISSQQVTDPAHLDTDVDATDLLWASISPDPQWSPARTSQPAAGARTVS